MSKKDSKSQELKELEEKVAKNTKYSGFGADTTIHIPCGFCAEPDYLVYRIVDTDSAIREGAICRHCKRGLKAIFHVDTPNQKRFELVQFCGPDAPQFVPPLRRISCRHCNDTHSVIVRTEGGDARSAMCTHCPVPCQKCRAGGVGAFCSHTPCECICHKEKNSGAS